MQIAFYAPLKAPTHNVPSGDRLMAQQLLKALQLAHHTPFIASDFRSYEGIGDRDRQAQLRSAAAVEVERLIRDYGQSPDRAPDAWFTYHLYYKAPDLLGPPICDALNIPYIVAEPSFAPKRANGPWANGHESVAQALKRAAVTLCLTRYDMEYVTPLVDSRDQRLLFLPPFVDATPFDVDASIRTKNRAELAGALALPADAIWLITVAMMRPGDKLASYRQLADALAFLKPASAVLLVVGDGTARPEVEAALRSVLPDRIRYLGELDAEALAKALTSADVCVWPAVGEAYGMALLEAQAAGLPVVAGRVRGVVDVVQDGQTGLLADADDAPAFATQLAKLLDDNELRERLSSAAREFVQQQRNLDTAAAILRSAIDLAVELNA